MRILKAGNFLKPPPEGGYTLIEIVIVIVIFSVLLSLTVLSMHSTANSTVQLEGKKLHISLRAAADEALVKNLDLGLELKPGAYEFVVFNYQEKNWEPYENMALPASVIPENIVLSVVDIEGETFPIRNESANTSREGPQILFLSSGETTAFTLMLSDAEGEYKLYITADGMTDIHLSEEH